MSTRSEEAVQEAIRNVAARLGFQPERLLMVDYQQEAATDDALPTLTDVFACLRQLEARARGRPRPSRLSARRASRRRASLGSRPAWQPSV